MTVYFSLAFFPGFVGVLYYLIRLGLGPGWRTWPKLSWEAFEKREKERSKNPRRAKASCPAIFQLPRNCGSQSHGRTLISEKLVPELRRGCLLTKPLTTCWQVFNTYSKIWNIKVQFKVWVRDGVYHVQCKKRCGNWKLSLRIGHWPAPVNLTLGELFVNCRKSLQWGLASFSAQLVSEVKHEIW